MKPPKFLTKRFGTLAKRFGSVKDYLFASQGGHMAATIRDVAKVAGVSITTVSHVLNGKGRTSEKVQQAVLNAVAQVGYKVDPVGRSLRTGKTGVLGIVFRPSDAISGSMDGTEYHIKVAGSAAAAALSQGFGLLHFPDLKKGNLPPLPMDGCVIVAPNENDPVVDFLQDRKVPFVLVDPDPGRPELEWSVKRDDYGGMQRLLDHLASNGAKRIAFHCGRDRNNWLLEAARAYHEWCAANEREAFQYDLAESGGPSNAYSITLDQLVQADRPDAIVTATSRFARGVVQAIDKLGLSIPKDIMLSTLSDSEISRGNSVPVTALNLHGEIMGRESINMLIHRLAGGSIPELKVVQPTLLIRQSTSR
jgi:DNA-binding LacI/PurR family transcriptional regulator